MQRLASTLLILALAGTAFAQGDPDPNVLCIDIDGTNCFQGTGAVVGYVHLSNLEGVTSITSWQGTLRVTGGIPLTGITLHPSSTNFLSPPDFQVSCNIPVIGGAATLVSFTVTTFTTDPVYVYLDDFSFNDGTPWQPCTGVYPTGEGRPLACLNCDCLDVVPAEATSWGAIKAIYR